MEDWGQNMEDLWACPEERKDEGNWGWHGGGIERWVEEEKDGVHEQVMNFISQIYLPTLLLRITSFELAGSSVLNRCPRREMRVPPRTGMCRSGSALSGKQQSLLGMSQSQSRRWASCRCSKGRMRGLRKPGLAVASMCESFGLSFFTPTVSVRRWFGCQQPW